MAARLPTSPLPKVAVVAVHGIADQRRGDTGQAVALQLAAASAGQVRAQDLPLHVAPLDPALGYQRWQPQGWWQRSRKALRQSWRSDFLDDTMGGAPGSGKAGNWAAAPDPDTRDAQPVADVGVRFTDYLLAKAAGARDRHGADAAPASVAVHQVRGPALNADVFEMHWADLSRLPGSVGRIVAELFTLMFHLSRLGIDALSLADALAPGGELRLLRRLQRLADWWFTRVLALLGLQLLVVALVLLPALWVELHRKGVAVSVALAVGAALAAVLVYRTRWRWSWALLWGLAGAVGLLLLLVGGAGYTLLMAAWLVLLSVAMWLFLAYCETRFRAVWGVGLVMYAATVGGILWFACEGYGGTAQDWVQGSFTVLEALLLLHAIGWGLFALLLAVTVGVTEWVLFSGRLPGTGLRQTLVTARLGLFTSAGAFLVCQMVVFEIAAWVLKCMLMPQSYLVWWFRTPDAGGHAALFLQQRADAHSGTFSLVAVVLLVLLGFVTLVFLPSVVRELRLASEPDPSRLGRWLTTGYRAVEQLVRLWAWPVALGALLVALLLLQAQLQRTGWVALEDGRLKSALDGLAVWDNQAQMLSDRWLGKLVLLMAGGAAGLLALGKVAVRQLQAVRAPLDAVLDVDNHFREFPRNGISRVLIIERYVALLDHLRQQGYTRVVLVAHSQGTVITAELLRYLQQRPLLQKGRHGGQPAPPGQVDMEQLRQWLDQIDLRLLTMGCPLRQLYALRFPALYPWPVAQLSDQQQPGWRGPRPAELGVRHWSNLWGTGDYVGRWLWAADEGVDPVPLQMDDARYAGEGVQGEDLQGRSWKDQALGPDAHTHYFDLEQRDVAAELVSLVAG
jgi:hypothetical protein